MDTGQALTATLAHQVEDLEYGQQDANQAGDHHEDGEDPFLGGSSDEAVHLVGTGLLLALDEGGEVVALVDAVQKVDEGGVHSNFENQGQDVGPPQASALLARVLVETLAVLAVFEAVFPFPVLPVGDVHHHQERGAGDKDELKGPQADVGHGEEVVVADVVAAWLSRVALEVLLFIAPYLLGGHHKHHHPEEEDNGEPYTAKGGGVLIHPAEEALEECPVHGEGDSQSVFWLIECRGSLLQMKQHRQTSGTLTILRYNRTFLNRVRHFTLLTTKLKTTNLVDFMRNYA